MTDQRRSGQLRGLLLGSGAGLSEPGMAELVVELTGHPAAGLELLYLGTATYDRPEPRERQTARFADLGCRISRLDLAAAHPARASLAEACERAAVVVVSGGNTLYALDRWRDCGLDVLLRDAVGRGLVVAGGSAGAICWFDGGHSDSMDPTSYRQPIAADDPHAHDWRYIRVDGLGLLPGLLCPHYDVIQSNGVLRASDFAGMLARHAGERGLGLDDWAGLLLDGDDYRVVAPEGRPGSARDGRYVDDRSGQPGLWILEQAPSGLERRLAATSGRRGELLRPATSIEPDPAIMLARAQNPAPV